ncbi:hypothetical protein [Cohnella sp.]|uniref:hypothetical protein n=1 Tax=Cohnella sp. TaxID=1883426 RepID=UPI00356180C3
MEEVVKKLRYKSGRAIVLHEPEGFRLGIETNDGREGKFDFVLLFVNNASEASERLQQTIPLLNEDAVFWITYPKQSSKIKTDINRDILWRLVDHESEYTLVSNVAVNETWSALRLRHKSKTGK